MSTDEKRRFQVTQARTFYETAVEVIDTHEPNNVEGWRDRAFVGEVQRDRVEWVLAALNERHRLDQFREARKTERAAMSEDELHAVGLHPDYEYEATEGPRKAWDDIEDPPEGDGWVRNTVMGRNGWDRFEFTEESYWRRKRGTD